MRGRSSHPPSALTVAARESFSPSFTSRNGRIIAMGSQCRSTNSADMNRSFQRRLDKVAQGINKLPPRIYTSAENRQWAEQRLVEMMADFKLSRAQALEICKAHAPTMAEWLEGQG